MPLSLGAEFMSADYRYEVQRTNNFEVVLDGMDDAFTLAVESAPSPSINNDPIELAYGNANVKVAGAATYDDFEITCKDFIDADMEAYLYEWRGQVYDPKSDRIGWAKDYKRDGYLHQYSPDGTCIRSWRIIGAWPTNFNGGDFAYDGADKKVITMTLAIDKAFLVRDGKEVSIDPFTHDSKGNRVTLNTNAGQA